MPVTPGKARDVRVVNLEALEERFSSRVLDRWRLTLKGPRRTARRQAALKLFMEIMEPQSGRETAGEPQTAQARRGRKAAASRRSKSAPSSGLKLKVPSFMESEGYIFEAISRSVRETFTETFGPSTAQVFIVPGHHDQLTTRTVRQVIERVPEIVDARRQEITERNIDALVEVYLQGDPVAEARRSIETDNARERARFLTDVPCLTSKQVAENAGHRAANASVTASRWKQQGKVFSVPWKGQELYPAFQFRDGQPHPSLAKALRELPKRFSPWQIAFWFTSSNGWLRGTTPAERLDDQAAVTMAAQRENEPIVG